MFLLTLALSPELQLLNRDANITIYCYVKHYTKPSYD